MVRRGTKCSKCGQPKAGKTSPMGGHGGPVTCESGIVYPPELLDLTLPLSKVCNVDGCGQKVEKGTDCMECDYAAE